jgi:hypothetical protein
MSVISEKSKEGYSLAYDIQDRRRNDKLDVKSTYLNCQKEEILG